MKNQQRTEGQRYQISVLREDNLSCHEIGICIRVSKSTVSREVRRNGTDGSYSAAEAQQLSSARQQQSVLSARTPYFTLRWDWDRSGVLSRSAPFARELAVRSVTSGFTSTSILIKPMEVSCTGTCDRVNAVVSANDIKQ